MKNEVLNYRGNTITFELGNGQVMVNATEMARGFNKKPNDWLKLKSTQEFLEVFDQKIPKVLDNERIEDLRFADNELVTVKKGGLDAGTWFHEDLALEFARWLSPAFAIWCNTKIKELLTKGQTFIGSNDQDVFILQAYQMLQQRVNHQSQELKKQAPKVDYYDMVLQSCSTYSTNHIAKELGMSAVTLNKRLYEKRVQYKQGEVWMLYHAYQDKGYTKTKTHVFTDTEGRTKTRMMTVWRRKRPKVHS